MTSTVHLRDNGTGQDGDGEEKEVSGEVKGGPYEESGEDGRKGS